MCSLFLTLVMSVMLGAAPAEDINPTTGIVPTSQIESSQTTEIVEALNPPPTTTTFRVTAYCSCEKCCGKWAKNRPKDENGNPIVRGASGKVLIPKVSVASPLPFGTQIELEGVGTVVVHDRTAKWVVDKYGQNILDLYFDNHKDAIQWGVKNVEGVIMK